ncbi:MAG: glycosyltransferase family 4 protein [Bacteroidales bacterium]|nr:glycosyltransferase family 4 protein [Bacteroidales bacterium]
MRILHICNDFCGSAVHANLYRRLDALGVSQTVFTYYRGTGKDGKNAFPAAHTEFIYRGGLRTIHRFLYHLKQRTVYRQLTGLPEIDGYDLCHATTLFSDGPLAYRLFRNQGIPYVVTVRKTDVNEFMKVAPHTWPTGREVLRHAERIVFISKAMQEKFCQSRVVRDLLPELQEKFVLQPNGIDDWWLDHVTAEPAPDNHSLLYVGLFDINKNVERLIDAVALLSETFPDIKLTLVGEGGCRKKRILERVRLNPQRLQYLGPIYDKERLQQVFRQHTLLAMPSIFETFGLVYLEALSQNLPVIYTRGQGIDGLLDERVGERVNPFSSRDIARAIGTILENRSRYSAVSSLVSFPDYAWETIAIRYLSLYETILAAASPR